MREIKFRAWDEDGYMFFPMLIEFRKDGNHIVWEDRNTFGTIGSGVIALMQFTGLKDKNGKDIYEGDIIKSSDEDGDSTIHQIIYAIDDVYPGFDLVPTLDVESNSLQIGTIDGCLEVIGNIYENPELLK